MSKTVTGENNILEGKKARKRRKKREREKKGKIAVIAALPMAGKEKKKTTRKH